MTGKSLWTLKTEGGTTTPPLTIAFALQQAVGHVVLRFYAPLCCTFQRKIKQVSATCALRFLVFFFSVRAHQDTDGAQQPERSGDRLKPVQPAWSWPFTELPDTGAAVRPTSSSRPARLTVPPTPRSSNARPTSPRHHPTCDTFEVPPPCSTAQLQRFYRPSCSG